MMTSVVVSIMISAVYKNSSYKNPNSKEVDLTEIRYAVWSYVRMSGISTIR